VAASGRPPVAGPSAIASRVDRVPGRRRDERRPAGLAAVRQAAGVERARQHPAHDVQRQARGRGDIAVGQAGGRQVEDADDLVTSRRIGLEQLRRRVAPEAEWRMAAGIPLLAELRGEALLRPPTMLPEPGLRALRLVDQLVPGSVVAREQLLVVEPDDDAGRMQVLLEQVECLAEVALPTVGSCDDQDVEGAGGRSLDHGPHRRRGVDRRAALRRRPGEPGVLETEAGDRAVDLLPLDLRPIAVVLASRRLTDPARRPQAPELGDGRGQPGRHRIGHHEASHTAPSAARSTPTR
jgi:hypothetical protein